MKKTLVLAAIVLIGLVAASCKEKSANSTPDEGVKFHYEASGCIGAGLPKPAVNDSSFSYTFTDKLTVDFVVTSNCCPDTNRFTVASIPGSDTLTIAVTDTAGHNCRCLCPYLIHAEFANLPGNHYVVRCTLGEPGAEAGIRYLVVVERN